MWLEPVAVPAVADGPYLAGIVVTGGEVVPMLEPGVVAGAWSPARGDAFGFTEMQRSALFEVANIGSGTAATALSELLARPVEISYPDATLATVGRPSTRLVRRRRPRRWSRPACAATPGGCSDVSRRVRQRSVQRSGTSIDDEVGRSALGEVGNILASSYLNAIVEMTGLSLYPEPPVVDIDVLGSLVERCLTGVDPGDPVVMMRSVMTIEAPTPGSRSCFCPGSARSRRCSQPRPWRGAA